MPDPIKASGVAQPTRKKTHGPYPRMSDGVSLRARLFWLAAAAITPLAVVVAIEIIAVIDEERERALRAGLDVTRALATAVDTELRSDIATLETLATAPQLDDGDFEGFRRRAERVLQIQANWIALNLADPSGQVLLHTSDAAAAQKKIVDQESFEVAVQTARPVVGYLARGPGGRLAIPVRVPVIRDGQLRYVLTGVVGPDAFKGVLARQRVAADWVVAVFDAKGVRIARSRAPEGVGEPASPGLQRLLAAGAPEMMSAEVTRTIDNEPVYTAYTRLPEYGWTVTIGMPEMFVDAAVTRWVVAYGGGLVLSLALGALAAAFVGRRITRPIADLRAAAQSLGRGATPRPPPATISEIREVGEALNEAAERRARTEAEREALLRSEHEARAAAEAANRAKDEFLAMLGHELRNPMAALAAAAQVLQHPRADEAARQRAREIIDHQIRTLSRLTNDLLDASRALTGKIELQRQPVDLGVLAAQTLATFQAASEAPRRFVPELDSVWVHADAVRLEQIITNLLSNALKYTATDGTISISTRREGDAEAVLRVADDGIGMPAELTCHAFDLFVQGARPADRASAGLGIGLTLVRRIAELHGGTAAAFSAGPGQGSELTVRLPAIEGLARASAARETARVQPIRCNVVLIEDNDAVRDSLRTQLELGGHRVVTERDGLAGLETVLSTRPDLALIDIDLPTLDGYEIVRRLRASFEAPPPLLVAMTGYGQPEDRRRAFDAGFDDHLTKPVAQETLDEVLRDAEMAAAPRAAGTAVRGNLLRG
ncbi:MAG TPA: ATP-binding protein [Burkholderiaceae bacterium]|nr:ATP-binding protein [Burkholderiaceae bacterium]